MNRLAHETSPYLQQHKDNPVDWYPWGDEAFAEARRRDVPVLLSVGYSACHWCHVMAHESFEDPASAAVMNELFVNVKVDREERPDVDAIYMDATQAMTGHGGWPMTVFLAPDGRPFYCGTYFPKVGHRGMPAFVDLCRAVAGAWQDRRADLDEQADKLSEAISRSALVGSGGRGDPSAELPGAEALAAAREALRRQHDDEWGGFGSAPKFPQTMSHELLLRGGDAASRDGCVVTSLDAMASGGIYDHLGGGFARYSVDRFWLVPHFEKMLYDQALLARLYLHAWQVTGEARYLQVLDETITYVLRDLRHGEGGFFSAEDADSEGVEGKFYVWGYDEVRSVAGEDACDWWGVKPDGNFEGHTILNRLAHRGDLERPAPIDEARARLFEAREQRVRPGLDDKILAEWNGLMIATIAEAGAATGRAEWVGDAARAADFGLRALRRDDGRWLRAWKDGHAKTLAFAADHGALVDAFLRLAEATGSTRWVDAATETADAMLDLFWDAEGGGLFSTGHDAEPLITRPKDLLDNATPSANSLAAHGLLRLAARTGDERYADRALAILRLLAGVAVDHPTAFGHLLGALDLANAGITEVVVAGDRPDLVRTVHERYLPNAVAAWGERDASPLWEGRRDGLAYVCREYVCNAPASTVEDLAAQLAATA